MDIPPEFGRDLSRFRSTLGHKCNHSFEPNSEFREFASHPRFGRVMSVVARRDVAAGEEVTCDYNYGKGDGEGPRWYRKAREGTDGQLSRPDVWQTSDAFPTRNFSSHTTVENTKWGHFRNHTFF